MDVSQNLVKSLPESVRQSLRLFDDDDAKQFLEKRLPEREIKEINQELQKRFPLAKERQVYKKRIRRQGSQRKQQLSNTKKRALGLYNINRNGLLFKDLLPLNDLWNQYIENLLDPPDYRAKKLHKDLTEFVQTCYKDKALKFLIEYVLDREQQDILFKEETSYNSKKEDKMITNDSLTSSIKLFF